MKVESRVAESSRQRSKSQGHLAEPDTNIPLD
jgi:hypothetical protein